MQGAIGFDNRLTRPARSTRIEPVCPSVVQRARSGNRRARAELLTRLADVWYRYCLSQLRDEHAARDAAQESATRFLAGFGRFKGDSRIETYAIGIAVNVCREHKRKRTHASDHDHEPPAPDTHRPDTRAQQREERDRITALIDRLPDRQREAVVLRYFEQLPLADVAESMGCALGTVKATLAHALRSLRKQWSQS